VIHEHNYPADWLKVALLGGLFAPALLAGSLVFKIFAPLVIRHASTPLREGFLECL
jgi:hypothetical protein